MKILHIITTIERGGAENQLNLLAQIQVDHGHTVQIMYLKGNEDLSESLKANNVKISTLLANKNIVIQILKLKLHLFRNQYDIIHLHLPQAELVARFATNHKAKIVITRHFGGKFHPRLPLCLSSFLGRVASKNAHTVIAISGSVKKVLLNNNEIFNPKSITVIYYGFSQEEFFKNSVGTELNLRNTPEILNIGCISRLSKEKDLETLIKAVHRLKQNANKIHLYIAGEGVEKNSLQKRSIEFGINHDITFLGKISNVANFLQNIDLLVLSSKFEGFGMVLLEAMATNTKIVAAKNSGIQEVLGNSGAGIYFETSNYLELSSKILYSASLNDDKYVIEQKKRLEKFSAARMFGQIEDIYNN